MPDFPTDRLIVARLLRDNSNLRDCASREKLWLLAKQIKPTIRMVTVDRVARDIQNRLGLYQPQTNDRRYILENEYCSFFGKGA